MRRLEASENPEYVAEAAASVIFRGGVIIFPTDTVYGIGCDPMNSTAVERIYALKDRPKNKPLALHFATVAELIEYVPDNPRAIALAKRFLPGALTLVVRRPRFVDYAVTAGLPSVGLRVPAHPLCWTVLEHTGPLAATSANFSGRPAYTGERFGRNALPDADLFIDAGPTALGHESTVLDLSGPDPRLIRAGALPLEALEAALDERIRCE